ncbi:Cyclin-H-like [Oopsacas minuta]|uniref:Cyclin-H-like n=1 Tax=Oopsacas minuta TaxID=111878 RepID=A0AAV7JVS9_9METZ|nr:Cyclin-H-like [Oopsacas minuta]
MFNESTHKKHWLFPDLAHIDKLRKEAYDKHIETYTPLNPITYEEQSLLIRHYSKELIKFCSVYNPPVPPGTIYTALTYFNRIYLREASIQLQPRDMMFSCAYLAFKVDEYNLSIDQFLKVLPKEMQSLVGHTVISFELTVMSALNCELAVYSPYRPLHGLLTDMKVRHSEEVELLKDKSEKYLSLSILTDVIFLYPPSQIALCAIYISCEDLGIDIEQYMTECLFSDQPDGMKQAIKIVRTQDEILKQHNNKYLGDSEWKIIEEKLGKCRNPEFDPRDPNFTFRNKQI